MDQFGRSSSEIQLSLWFSFPMRMNHTEFTICTHSGLLQAWAMSVKLNLWISFLYGNNAIANETEIVSSKAHTQ